MTPKQQKIIDEMRADKNLRTGIFEKAYSRVSRSNAIKAKCLDCTCFLVSEISSCTVESCPLWAFRPYQEKEELEGEE